MALKKSTTTNTAAFEQEPGAVNTAVAEREAPAAVAPAPVATAPAPEPTAAAKAETTVALAKASNSSLARNDAAALAKSFQKEVAAMRGAADFTFGNHRAFKVSNAGIIQEAKGEKLKLGRWIEVRLLAWDLHYEISPGEDGKDSGQFVAYSKDGHTIDHVIGEELKGWIGKDVQDYLKFLREDEEFDRASKREFLDTQVAVINCEDEPDFHEPIQLTLASSSIQAFNKYQNKLEGIAKCVAMGLEHYSLPADPLRFFFIREGASDGKREWMKLNIVTTLPAKI